MRNGGIQVRRKNKLWLKFFFHPDLRWGDWSSGPKHKHLFEAISVRNRFTPPVPKEEDVEEEKEEGDNDIAPVHDEGEEDEDDEEENENSEEGSQEPGTEDHEHEEHNSEEEGVDEEEKEEEGSDLFPTSFNETDFSSNNSTDHDIIDVVRKKRFILDLFFGISCLVHMLYHNMTISLFILIDVAQ